MKWNDFIASLKEAKKQKKNKGLSVSAISTLIFSGAMDSMIEDKPGLAVYLRMFNEARSALGSKANLAKKKKTELMGLADVKTTIQLSLWRYQVNPLSSFDILEEYKDKLRMLGFLDTNNPGYPMKSNSEFLSNSPVVLSPYWRNIFTNPKAMSAFEDGSFDLAIFGTIVDARVVPYDEGRKTRLLFKIFTGVENTDDITVWPGRTGKITESQIAGMSLLNNGCAIIKPKPWNGKPGAVLKKWVNINGNQENSE
jgi:hypothetical protein